MIVFACFFFKNHPDRPYGAFGSMWVNEMTMLSTKLGQPNDIFQRCEDYAVFSRFFSFSSSFPPISFLLFYFPHLHRIFWRRLFNLSMQKSALNTIHLQMTLLGGFTIDTFFVIEFFDDENFCNLYIFEDDIFW